MSLIININSLSYLYDYLDLGVHDFIVGTNQFSCRQALTVDYIELKEIKEKPIDTLIYEMYNKQQPDKEHCCS